MFSVCWRGRLFPRVVRVAGVRGVRYSRHDGMGHFWVSHVLAWGEGLPRFEGEEYVTND